MDQPENIPLYEPIEEVPTLQSNIEMKACPAYGGNIEMKDCPAYGVSVQRENQSKLHKNHIDYE